MDNDDKVKDEIIDDGTQNSQDSKELARLNREDDFSKELMDMLAIISPKDRKLFLELYVEELSLDEISQRSGIKKSVLYNRISRAKKRIRERRDKHE